MTGSMTASNPYVDDDEKKKRKPSGNSGGNKYQIEKQVVWNPTEKVSVKGIPPQPPAVGYPTSQVGIQVPYIVGRQRIFEPNVMWYGNLNVKKTTVSEVISVEIEKVDETEYDQYAADPISLYVYKTPIKTVQTTTYVEGYTLDVQLGLCLGPDVHMLEIYVDGAKKWQGDASGAKTVIGASEISEPDFWATWTFYDGRFDQLPADEILNGEAPGYVGVAVLTIAGANATGVFPAIAVEVARWPNPLGLAADVNVNADGDVNPMTALHDVITNKWGGSGVNSARINASSLTAAALVLAAEGNFLSIFNQTPVSGTDLIAQIENQTYGVCYVDPETDEYVFKLIRYDLFDFDNALALNVSNTSEVRAYNKSSWLNAATRAIGKYTNRAADYQDGSVPVQSPMVAGSNKEIRTESYGYPLAMSGEVASKLVARDMVILNQPASSCEVRANRQAANLTPGTPVTLTWPEYGLVAVPMVVLTRKEPPDQIGVILQLSEVINANASVLYTVPEPSLFDPPVKEPTSPVDAEVKSAPYWIQVRAYDGVWTKEIKVCTPLYFVEAYNSLQTSFDVRMLNFPDQPSPPVGDQPVINGDALFASVGYLASELSAFDGFGDGIANSVIINGVIRDDYMKSPGLAGVKDGELFMFIDDEILSFQQSEDEGAGVWTLTNVHRGLLDTVPQTHAAGAKCWVINGRWKDRIGASFDIEPDYIPEFRFCSRTLKKKQSDEGLEYSGWTPNNRVNRPLPPMDTRIENVRSSTPYEVAPTDVVTVSWKTRSRNKIERVPVFADAAHKPEVSNRGVWQLHRVWLTDSSNTSYELGNTTSSGSDPNTLEATIPSGVVDGLGAIWVQAYNDFGNARQAELYPINISGGVASNTVLDHLGEAILDETSDPITE